MYCQNCGNQLPPEAKICNNCGQKIKRNGISILSNIHNKKNQLSYSGVILGVISIITIFCLYQNWYITSVYRYDSYKCSIWKFLTSDIATYMSEYGEILINFETILLMVALFAVTIFLGIHLIYLFFDREKAYIFGKIGMIIALIMSISTIIMFFAVDIVEGIERGGFVANSFTPTIWVFATAFLSIAELIYIRRLKTGKNIF